MNKNTSFHFLIIDDSPFDIRIAEKIIENIDRHLSITAFVDAKLALAHIKQGRENTGDEICIVLLDMQMPLMHGSEFIKGFEELPVDIRRQYKIILQSASINFKETISGKDSQSIFVTLEKPLSEAKLLTQLAKL